MKAVQAPNPKAQTHLSPEAADALRDGIIAKTKMYSSLALFIDALTELVKTGTTALANEMSKKAGK